MCYQKNVSVIFLYWTLDPVLYLQFLDLLLQLSSQRLLILNLAEELGGLKLLPKKHKHIDCLVSCKGRESYHSLCF